VRAFPVLVAVMVLASTLPPPTAAAQELPPYTNMITLPAGEEAVGLCYPWLVLTHSFLDLSTWTMTPGIGGDRAELVECGDDYFIVVGANGVYVVNREDGAIIDVVLLGAMEYLGSTAGTIALYDPIESLVVVHSPGSGDMHVPLPQAVVALAYTVVSGVPIVAYIADYPGARVLALASPTRTVNITELPAGSTAVAANGATVYVEYEGLRAYTIVDAAALEAAEDPAATVYLPFGLSAVLRVDPPTVYVRTDGGSIVAVDTEDKTWALVGAGELTPVGVYLNVSDEPAAATTYVRVGDEYYPVPGRAVARIGSLVVTNYPDGEGTVPVLWPLNRTALIATAPVAGLLQVPDGDTVRVVRVDLPPGTHILPRGATILTDHGLIPLDADIVYYPPPDYPEPAPPEAPVAYTVADYPEKHQVVDEFTGVSYVTSGAGKLLIITHRQAIVYAESGVVTVIPGVWKWGGVGEKIVLYDGASIRVYDYAGNPVAAHQAYIIDDPVHVTYYDGYVDVYGATYHVRIAPDGSIETLESGAPAKLDPVYGVEVVLAEPARVRLGEFAYTIPEFESVNVNLLQVAWTAPLDNETAVWFILDIANATVYALLGAPRGEVYPLGDYLAYYNGSSLRVLPYKSWVASNCYVDIVAPDSARIYVDGVLVGEGSIRYYADCYRTIRVKAEMDYHRPDEKLVTVRPGGVKVELEPEPLVSLVTLEVLAPESLPVEAVTLSIDGEVTTWRVGEAREMIAGKPYNITVLSFHPFDVCHHPTLQATFREGEDTLQVPCEPAGAVLGVKSSVPARVTILRDGLPMAVATVDEGRPFYTLVEPGDYTIVSEPMEEGYANRTVNVTVPPYEVVVVDVTPYKYSRLVVVSIPPIADIQVLDLNGTVVASGVGNVSAVVPPGEYQVIATAPGFQQYVDFVVVGPGESRIVNVTLVPLQTQTQAPEERPSLRVHAAVAAAIAAGVAAALLWRRRRIEEAEVVEQEV